MSPLADNLVSQVRELLATGLNQRVVSQMTGVSRGSVGKIAAGKYPDYARIRKDREEKRLPGTGPVEWCGKCRRFVAMSCVECAARKARAETPRRGQAFFDTDDQDGLELDLRDEQQAAYEEVHAMRVRQDRENSPLQAGHAELDGEDDEQEEPPEVAMLSESSPQDARRKLAAALAMGPDSDRRARSA